VLGPTIGEYARAAQLAGADVRPWTANPGDGFAINADEISVKLAEHPWVVFICNPNNPTGQCLPADVIQSWATAHPETIFIVDEAYLSFVPGMQSAIYPAQPKRQNLLVLRSMTKDYALAGLRLGYALGPTNLIAALAAQRAPWNVNALAQAAWLAALQDPAHLAQTLTQLRQEKKLLVTGFQHLGYHPLSSQTHFFLLPV
jgi:histidinol-phosphate aminotransferase